MFNEAAGIIFSLKEAREVLQGAFTLPTGVSPAQPTEHVLGSSPTASAARLNFHPITQAGTASCSQSYFSSCKSLVWQRFGQKMRNTREWVYWAVGWGVFSPRSIFWHPYVQGKPQARAGEKLEEVVRTSFSQRAREALTASRMTSSSFLSRQHSPSVMLRGPGHSEERVLASRTRAGRI